MSATFILGFPAPAQGLAQAGSWELCPGWIQMRGRWVGKWVGGCMDSGWVGRWANEREGRWEGTHVNSLALTHPQKKVSIWCC